MDSQNGAPIVLFVDDEQLIRKYFERAFSGEMNVKTVAGGDEARAVLDREGERVAVLLTDQRMPAGDGVSLLNEVKTRYPHIVRLLTTAYSDIDEAIAAVNHGQIWRYVTKPWDLEDLREVLNSALLVYRARVYEQALLSERRRGMLMVASHIAHEMRTPLRSIHSAAHGVERYLPRLLAGHDRAVHAGADIEPLSHRHRQILGDTLSNVQRIVERANAVIDLLLANAGTDRIDPALFDVYEMTDCVARALRDFPLTEDERAAVFWCGGPAFHFNGSFNLMILVLHNLLRNALRAVRAAGRGDVQIWTDVFDHGNGLHVRDTGTGIDEQRLAKIFDDFTSFANDTYSVGIGLGFCRRVMTSFGGWIDCHSEHNSYTQFDLWLPMHAPSQRPNRINESP